MYCVHVRFHTLVKASPGTNNRSSPPVNRALSLVLSSSGREDSARTSTSCECTVPHTTCRAGYRPHTVPPTSWLLDFPLGQRQASIVFH